MEGAGMFLFAAAAIGAALLFTSISNRKRDDILKEIGGQYQLSFSKGSFFDYSALGGSLGKTSVNVSFTRSNKTVITIMKARLNFAFPMSFSIKPEGFGSKFQHMVGIHDIQIGDREFDDKMLIESNNVYLLRAFLNQDLRRIILDLYAEFADFSITTDEINCTSYYDPATLEHKITRFFYLVNLISGNIYQELTPEQRLFEIIKHDSSRETLRSCFTALMNVAPAMTREISAFLTSLLESPDPIIRIESAIRLGRETAEKHIGALLESPNTEIAAEAAEYVPRYNLKEYIAPLKKLYDRKRDWKTREVVIKAFQAIGDTSLSGFLLDILQTDRNADQLALVKALGSCGTIDTVEVLYDLASNPLKVNLNAGVKEAIAKIQSRSATGDKGWVSMADHDDEKGDLSISDE